MFAAFVARCPLYGIVTSLLRKKKMQLANTDNSWQEKKKMQCLHLKEFG